MYATLEHVQKSYGAELILEDVTLTINEKDRVGLIGVNGAGKTTLLNILVKKLFPDNGSVTYKADLSIGYLEQNSGLQVHNTIWEEMRNVFSEVLAAQKKLDGLAHALQETPDDLTLQKKYAETLSFVEAKDGYHIDVNIKKILNGMGFFVEDYGKSIDALSGGEKTRLALARLILRNPELLILDEPTNHLDLNTLAWLEDYLSGYSGAMIVVSHDRYFLDKVTNKTWELDDYAVMEYRGNYSSYKVQKAERLEHQIKEYKKQSRQISHMQDYVQKNIARASTSTRAKSRLAQLSRMEVLKKPKIHVKTPTFSFPLDKQTGVEVLAVKDLKLAVGEEQKALADHISFDVKRGEKIAILGDNGTGKTTLLKSLSGKIRQRQGEIDWGKNVDIGYYDQENKDMHAENTALSELQGRFPSLLEYDARSILGRVLLIGDDVFKRVSSLSGGERAKLGFAILMAGKHNTLLLDEPTNHLDLAARESLESALKEYAGTLLFVSHDRYFVNALCARIFELDGQRLHDFSGSYEEFSNAKKQAEFNAEASTDTGDAPPHTANAKPANRKEERQIQAAQRLKVSALEKEIASLEQEEKNLQEMIGQNPCDYEVLNESCAKLESVKVRLEKLTAEWLELV